MIKYFLPFLLSFFLISCSSQSRSTELVIPAVKNNFFVFEVSNGIEAFFDKDATKSISEYYKT
jgi:hypothetical protein